MNPVLGNSLNSIGANKAPDRAAGKPQNQSVASAPHTAEQAGQHRHTSDCRESGFCEFDQHIASLRKKGMA